MPSIKKDKIKNSELEPMDISESKKTPANPADPPDAAKVTAPSLQKSPPKTAPIGFFKKVENLLAFASTVPLSEKLFFTETFRVMVKAGLSISESLETLALQTKNKKFKKVLEEIKDGVMAGNALGSMFEQYPKIFPEYFTNMIKVGEMSGNLENNLEQLSIQMKKDHDLTSKVKGAMMYPAIIVAAVFGIGILMFVYVLPNILSIFEEMKMQLPLATRIMIAISKFINQNAILGILIAVGLILTIVTLLKTKQGKKAAHTVLLNSWIIGPIIKKINLARFARTISSLLKTDVPVVDSFKITATVLGNVHYKQSSRFIAEEIAHGVSISSILAKAPKLYPPVVTQMVLVGEKSGTIDELLAQLANFYEEEVTDIIRNLSSIIEPIMIVFLGGMVGVMAMAIISPIYSLTEGMT